MTPLRTYRILPLLFAATLLLGLTAPTVQAMCAAIHAMPAHDMAADAAMPCHGDVPDVPATPADHDGACCTPMATPHAPADPAPAPDLMQCCDAAPVPPATLSAETLPRLLPVAWLPVIEASPPPLPPGLPLPSVATTAPLPSLIDDPALLSTFLL